MFGPLRKNMQIMCRNHKKAVSVALCPGNVFATHQSTFNLSPKTKG